ncbi:MAG: hypothetical protein ACOYMF_07810 [Bacteroidales bacterium]
MTNLYTTRPAPKRNLSAAKQNLFRFPALFVLVVLMVSIKGWSQPTTVFADNFNRDLGVSPLTNGGTPTMTWTTASTASPAGISITNAATVDPANYVVQMYPGATPAAGRTYITGPLSTFSSPFSTTLNANPGPVTWTFNMKTNRSTALSGFDAGNYGSAVILAISSANPTNTSTNGYAVVLVKGTTNNALKLVRFANGLVLNSNVTTIIGPSPDLGTMTRYASIKVLYTPSSNIWELYVRDDGSTTDPTDPATGTLTQVGTSTLNSNYTSTAMTSCGFLWNHSNGAGSSNKGMYDNFTVVVSPVLTPTISVTPSSLSNFNYVFGSLSSPSQPYSISGVNLDGSTVTVTGSTNYEVSLNNSDFYSFVNVPYSGATLSSTTIYVRLKLGLPTGNYNLENVGNAGGGASTPANVTCSGYVLGPPATYAWTGSTSNDWQVAGNWNPARSAPAINDILRFDNGGTYTITNVTTQTIAQLLVSGGSKITLQAPAATIITIAGTAGDDLTVSGSSSELNISGTFALSLSLNAGTNGLISSSMTVSGAAHVVKSADANSLVFASGSIFKATTGFTGSVFGTTSLNSVKFQSGSTYIQDAGSNPFGAGQPNSVLTFETGSLYKFTAASGGPSYSGRTYANFENDSPLTTQNNQGSSPFTCDNYTVTSGTVNWDFTAPMTIKGNIIVNTPAILTFGKATKTTNLTLNGSIAQTISGTGFMDFGALGSLIINNTAGITLSSQATLFNLTITSGAFKVASGASLITGGTVSGDVTVERNFTAGPNTWHLFCLPTSNSFMASPLFDGAYVDEYIENTGAWNRLVDVNTLNPKTGYSVKFPSGSHILDFTGTINSGDQTYSSLSYTTGAPGYGPGWHFIGNPFPSAVDLDLGIWTKTNLDGYVYVWDGNQYVCGPTTPSGYGTLTDNVVPAMQGFFVKANAANAELLVPQASRVHSSSFYKKAETSDNLMFLKVTGNGYEDKAVVAFNQSSTVGFDSDYDAYKLFGITEAPQLYSIIADNILTVNSLPSMEANSDVSLGFKAGAETTYTLTVSGIENFNTATPLLLEDVKTSTTQDLRQNPVYSFSAAPADTEHRFNLHFKNTSGIGETDTGMFSIYSNMHILYVRNPNGLQGTIEVYDITGRLLSSTRMTGNQIEKTDMVNYTGCLLVKVITIKGIATGKVFVN